MTKDRNQIVAQCQAAARSARKASLAAKRATSEAQRATRCQEAFLRAMRAGQAFAARVIER